MKIIEKGYGRKKWYTIENDEGGFIVGFHSLMNAAIVYRYLSGAFLNNDDSEYAKALLQWDEEEAETMFHKSCKQKEYKL